MIDFRYQLKPEMNPLLRVSGENHMQISGDTNKLILRHSHAKIIKLSSNIARKQACMLRSRATICRHLPVIWTSRLQVHSRCHGQTLLELDVNSKSLFQSKGYCKSSRNLGANRNQFQTQQVPLELDARHGLASDPGGLLQGNRASNKGQGAETRVPHQFDPGDAVDNDAKKNP